ncbi:MAG: PHP domain protein, partial [Candidatus Woesebacteria bacterium GW2011_GWA1_44_23]
TIEKGEHTASILLPGGVQVDLMAQPVSSYGSLLQHFTGSKHHNIALREFALKKGLSLSEYGIRKSQTPSSKIQTFKTEKDFYKFLGLDYIEPELRATCRFIPVLILKQVMIWVKVAWKIL